MTRKLFRGAPELSRLFVEAPTDLLRPLLSREQFREFLAQPMSGIRVDEDEAVFRQSLTALVSGLREDRLALIEAEARRVTAMSDDISDTMLRRLGDDGRAQEVHPDRCRLFHLPHGPCPGLAGALVGEGGGSEFGAGEEHAAVHRAAGVPPRR